MIRNIYQEIVVFLSFENVRFFKVFQASFMTPELLHQFVTRIFFIVFLFDFYLFISTINFPINLKTTLFHYCFHHFYIMLKSESFNQTLRSPFYSGLFSSGNPCHNIS